MTGSFAQSGIRPIAEIPVRDLLGEGIVWDDVTQAFVWIDIEGRRLHRLAWPSLQLESFTTPFRIGSFALTETAGLIVAAFEQGFARFEFASGAWAWIARPDLATGVRFNDGRVDRQGRFVAGTLVESGEESGKVPAGKLYRLERDASVTTLVEGLSIPNALCWSPDGQTMYHTDTLSHTLTAYDYGDGATGGRPFASLPKGHGPDGATVDAESRIWVALWGGARVAVFGPDGSTLGEVAMPVTQPTCPALGGSNLDILAVTSASAGLSESELAAQPSAGNLFLFEVPATGLREHRITLDHVL